MMVVTVVMRMTGMMVVTVVMRMMMTDDGGDSDDDDDRDDGGDSGDEDDRDDGGDSGDEDDDDRDDGGVSDDHCDMMMVTMMMMTVMMVLTVMMMVTMVMMTVMMMRVLIIYTGSTVRGLPPPVEEIPEGGGDSGAGSRKERYACRSCAFCFWVGLFHCHLFDCFSFDYFTDLHILLMCVFHWFTYITDSLISNTYILRVSDQNGVSPLCVMLEIHHSGWEPSNYVIPSFSLMYLFMI